MPRTSVDRSSPTDLYVTTRAAARTAHPDDTRNRGIAPPSAAASWATPSAPPAVASLTPWHVDKCDIAPDIVNFELGLLIGAIGRAGGAPVVPLTFAQLCLGAGR